MITNQYMLVSGRLVSGHFLIPENNHVNTIYIYKIFESRHEIARTCI